MKNLIDFTKIFGILFLGMCLHYLITYDTKRDNNRQKDAIIDSLEVMIDTLQKYSIKDAAPGFIQVGDTTLQYMTADPEKYLHKEHISQGKSFHNFATNDHQRVEMFIFNY